MTLETAKRLVLEQGENASKEARAVVRGGMTICECREDGRRTYPWIKVLPTKTDDESSIDLALKMRRALKQSFNPPKQQKPESQPIVFSNNIHVEVPPHSLNIEESFNENQKFSISTVISNVKEKIRKLMIYLDEIVVE